MTILVRRKQSNFDNPRREWRGGGWLLWEECKECVPGSRCLGGGLFVPTYAPNFFTCAQLQKFGSRRWSASRLLKLIPHLPGMLPRCVCGGMSVAAFGKNCSGEIKKKCSREADISLVASSISITKFWQMIELGTIHDWSWRWNFCTKTLRLRISRHM